MLADREQTAVQHPMLTRIRACSTTPDAAASFFTAVLHPKPSARLTGLQALEHPYLRQCVHQMQDHYHPPPFNPPRNMEERMACDALPEAASHRNMLRSLGTAGRAAGLAGFAVAKSVAKAVSGKRRHDMSQYFPDYTHPQHDFDLLPKSESDSTAVARDSATSNHPSCQGSGASLLAADTPCSGGQLSASAQQVSARQQRSAAAHEAADRQRPKPMAKPQFKAPDVKSRKLQQPLDPLHQAKASVRVDPQRAHASSIPGSPISNAHAEQAPEAAVAVAGGSDTAIAVVETEAPDAAVAISTEAPDAAVAIGTEAPDAAVAITTESHSTSDATAVTAITNHHVAASTATAAVTPAETQAEQQEPALTAAHRQACIAVTLLATALALRTLPAGSVTTAAATVHKSGAPSTANVSSARCKAGESLHSHRIELLPQDDEGCDLGTAQQRLQSHPIQLFPEDEEDCQMVDQLQGQQNHSPVSVTDGGEGRDSDPHRQPSRLQCHAVSSLNSCIDMDSHMADTSNTQQVSVATAGSHNADGATHGLALHVGSIYGLPTSDRWRQDRGDDAHSEAGSTTPASPDEELYAARYIETTVADRLVCWDNSTRLQK